MSTSFNYPFRVGNREDYQNILKELNNKIDSIKKRVSYFDFYNITTAVTDSNSFAAQINSLPFNEALVVNTPPFYYSGENYSTGDVIIKNSTGGIHHIKAQTGGVYYPEQVKYDNKDGTYSFTYTYADSMPTEPTSEVEIGQKAILAEKITFNSIRPNDATETNIYGEWGHFDLYSNIKTELQRESGKDVYKSSYIFCIEALTETNNELEYIRPFIQLFMCTSGTPIETVYLDYELILDKTNFQKTCWVVKPKYQNKEISSIYVKVK